jgi:hypothetical protein
MFFTKSPISFIANRGLIIFSPSVALYPVPDVGGSEKSQLSAPKLATEPL